MNHKMSGRGKKGRWASKRRRGDAKLEKVNALVIKAEQSKYSKVLQVMRRNSKLVELGADVHNIRRIHTGEMILKLKRDEERKCTAYKSLADEILGEAVEVMALTAEATLKVKNLDEVTEVEELLTAPRQQRKVQMATAAVRLRKGLAETHVALV